MTCQRDNVCDPLLAWVSVWSGGATGHYGRNWFTEVINGDVAKLHAIGT